MPSRHSWNKPTIRRTKNRVRVRIAVSRDGSCRHRGMGRRRATSTSKIRKMTANRKNRREKGVRAEFLGSKPHSKGVRVSWVIK